MVFCAVLPTVVTSQEIPPVPTPSGSAGIDRLMEEARQNGLMTGGVVLVGRGEEVLLEKAYGYVSAESDAAPVSISTIFDLASLTKVFATAPSIMKLAEDGKIHLAEPIVRWFPEFADKERDDLLVMHLLTHTSGLDDVPATGEEPLQRMINAAAAQRPKGETGVRFRYADINFILLGELVRRASGMSLENYSREHFFAPLGMTDTMFRPDTEHVGRCAPTTGSDNSLLRGVVQDPVARALGGVAGHAGLFGTAGDLAKFCCMLLDGGEFDGVRVLSARAVEQMTAPYFSRGGKVIRGLGWDIASPYSSPRGDGFSEGSFGHTGYAGGSVWIDPDSRVYVILLTSRLDYRRLRDFNALRTAVSTAAMQLALEPGIEPPEDGLSLNP